MGKAAINGRTPKGRERPTTAADPLASRLWPPPEGRWNRAGVGGVRGLFRNNRGEGAMILPSIILPRLLCLPRPRFFQVRSPLPTVFGVHKSTGVAPGEVLGHQIVEPPKPSRRVERSSQRPGIAGPHAKAQGSPHGARGGTIICLLVNKVVNLRDCCQSSVRRRTSIHLFTITSSAERFQ